MTTSQEHIKTRVKALALTNSTMMFGLLLFGTISFVMADSIPFEINDKKKASFIAITSLIFSIVGAGMLDGALKRKQDTIRESGDSTIEKLNKYSKVYLITLAVLEAIGIAGIICFLLTGRPLAMVASFVSILLMIAHRPTIKKMVSLVV